MLRREILTLLAAAPLYPQQGSRQSLRLRARSRRNGLAVDSDLHWQPASTAIIICDMWNGHYCQNSVKRIEEIVPRMNHTIAKARALGVRIIHAPSSCMDQYENTPQRARMKAARAAAPPVEIAKWCYLDLKDEAPLPVDDTRQPCDDGVVGERVRRYTRQHPGLTIMEPDGISDSGQEIYNFLEQESIANVAMMGVHTNMCVLGRPFGIRQLTRLGKSVVLARDLTDAMYDPREAPWVSHERGTQLVIEHVERYWCPTIAGADLTALDDGRRS
ncbi:MAG: isochorismatase family protein [Bryobacteraceae bacterium]